MIKVMYINSQEWNYKLFPTFHECDIISCYCMENLLYQNLPRSSQTLLIKDYDFKWSTKTLQMCHFPLATMKNSLPASSPHHPHHQIINFIVVCYQCVICCITQSPLPHQVGFQIFIEIHIKNCPPPTPTFYYIPSFEIPTGLVRL